MLSIQHLTTTSDRNNSHVVELKDAGKMFLETGNVFNISEVRSILSLSCILGFTRNKDSELNVGELH